jgi:hypothetical protein
MRAGPKFPAFRLLVASSARTPAVSFRLSSTLRTAVACWPFSRRTSTCTSPLRRGPSLFCCLKRSFLLQMDLIRRFDNAVSYLAVKIPNLDTGRRYEILSAERVTTKHGPSILLTITIGPSDSVKVFLPTRYSSVITML